MDAAVELALAAVRSLKESKVGLEGEEKAAEFFKRIEEGLGNEEKEYAAQLFRAYAPLVLLLVTREAGQAPHFLDPDSFAPPVPAPDEELDDADWEKLQRELDEMLA